MSFLFSWLFTEQQTTVSPQQLEPAPLSPIESNDSSPLTVRFPALIYLPELKQRLSDECRAERAECTLDFSDQRQRKAFLKHREQLVANVIRAGSERANCQNNAADIARLQCREKRLFNDLGAELALQTDWCAVATSIAAAANNEE